MNRYPLWKYLLLAFALVVGLLYTLPNFYGEAPAVQVSSGKATLKLDAGIVPRIEAALGAAGVKADFVQFEGNSAKARFADTDWPRIVTRWLPGCARNGIWTCCKRSRVWR